MAEMESAKLGLETAIKSGDMGTVKDIIGQNPEILRAPVTEYGQTPLHLACKYKRGEMVPFLIDEEKERVKSGAGGTPSYNMKDSNGETPVFVAVEWNPTRLVELHLELDDLEVTCGNGMPLLWYCARWGRVSEKVARDVKLRGQIGQRWKGQLPLEAVPRRSFFQVCTVMVRALEECDDRVKALNLGALLLMCEKEKPRVEKVLNANSGYYLSLRFWTSDQEKSKVFWDGIDNWEDPSFTNSHGTLLQLAVKYNVERAIKFLLRQQCKGLDPHASVKGGSDPRSPAVIAANHGYCNILKMFTNSNYGRPVDLSQTDENTGRNLLHQLFDRGNINYYKGLNPYQVSYVKCVDMLAEDILRKEVNSKDKQGNTPLHLAAKVKDRGSILALLKKGASVTAANEKGDMPFGDIPTDILQEFLDSQVSSEGNKEDFKITFNLTLFDNKDWSIEEENEKNRDAEGGAHQTMIALNNIQDTRRQNEKIYRIEYMKKIESETLLKMFETSPQHKALLTHPVLASFLDVKWMAIRWNFACHLTLYSIFSVLFTTYTFISFGGMTLPINAIYNESVVNYPNTYEFNNAPMSSVYAMSIALILFTVILILWEVLQMFRNLKSYLSDIENYIQIFLIVSTMVIVFKQWVDSKGAFNSSEELRHLAALCVVLTWTMLLFVMGRSRSWFSTYVAMFRRVALTYTQLMTFFAILIVAYGFAFYIMFHKDHKGTEMNDDFPFFNYWGVAVFKMFSMFMGELEFSDLYKEAMDMKENGFVSDALTVIVYMGFIFMVLMVLTNLLNGLAVSDVAVIATKADIDSSITRLEMIAETESLLIVLRRYSIKVFVFDTQIAPFTTDSLIFGYFICK